MEPNLHLAFDEKRRPVNKATRQEDDTTFVSQLKVSIVPKTL